MAHLFIRVELRGSPGWEDYEKLHAFMETKNWFRTIQGTAGRSETHPNRLQSLHPFILTTKVETYRHPRLQFPELKRVEKRDGFPVGPVRDFAEHLLNNRLQMRCFGATEGLVTLTKQTKIGRCEQVKVN